MSRSTPSLLADATRDLAEFAVRTEYDDIPPAVIERVKLSFIDGLGVCLHGATLPWTQRLISWSIAPAAAGPQRGLRR